MSTVSMLLDLHTWTHQSLDKLLDSCAKLEPGQLLQEVPDFGIPTLWKLLVHLLHNEPAWIADIGGPSSAMEAPAEQTLDALRVWKEEIRQQTRQWLSEQTDETLDEVLSFSFSWGSPSGPRRMFVAHTLTHSYHHKGQAAAMLRFLGHPAGDTDIV